MPNDYILGLLGGVMMGVACTALVLFNGRILGVSGLLGGAISFGEGASWRWAFIVGMLIAGVVTSLLYPAGFAFEGSPGPLVSLLGGLLVGAGTQLGSGCTSGHGICGVGRLSKRSVVATLVFMSTGAVGVVLRRGLLGGGP